MRALLPVLVALMVAGVPGGARAQDEGGAPVPENRLADSRSPYLRQHKDNPVAWWPWGEEAFARAREQDRPILLSVGYAACHWCHVMEHESFEDEATAALLNDTFVCVKVDREERPDVDALYMTAVQVMSGRGGWPMTVLMTPEGEAFWAGTYLPRDALQQLTRRVATLWDEQREQIEQQARMVTERVQALAGGMDLPAFEGDDASLLAVLEGALTAAFDRQHAGYGSRPKFPPHTELLHILEEAARGRASPSLREQARATLVAMAEGGVHDQVGGGFHRYSTDERWLLPHFEKMLYDNALLAQAYAAQHALTGEARFARVARDILGWVEREMARPQGGYAASLDADTEGEEGLTYTWTVEELEAALSPGDLAFAQQVFGVEPGGNFRDEATGRPTGRNILHLPRSLEALAADEGVEVEALRDRVDAVARRLLEVRQDRPQPGLDDKVITAWNGLLLSAFARCGAALGEARYLERGRRLAEALLARSRREDGTLLRFPRDSGPEIVGFCDDHVHLAEGLLDLADATGEARWADEARALGDALLRHFHDPAGGGFWRTSADAHESLLARQKETWDSPIPSDNGTAARLLLRLAARTGDARCRAAADDTLATWRPLMGQARMARGVAALHRALALRLALDGGGEADEGGDGDASAAGELVRATAWLQRSEVRPGGRVALLVRLRIGEGWHVNPGGSEAAAGRVPTTLEVAEPAIVVLEDVRWPDPVTRPLGGEEVAMLEGTVDVRATLQVPPDAPHGPRRVRLRLGYQPCNEGLCQEPEELLLELPLRFAAEDGPARHPGRFADDGR